MDELQLYHENEALRLIDKAHASRIKVAKLMWGLARKLIEPGERVGVGKTSVETVCLGGAYAKQMRLFLANYRLSRQGLSNEALLVLRSMYAMCLFIDAMWHSADRAEFARYWMLWGLANDEKQVRNILTWNPGWESLHQGLADGLSVERGKMGPIWKEFVRNGPVFMSLSDLAKLLDTEEGYRAFYPLASGVTHGYDLLFYCKPSDDDRIEIPAVPTGEYIEANLSSAASFLRDSCVKIDSMLGLGKEKVVADMDRLMRTLVSAEKVEGLFKKREFGNYDWRAMAREKSEESRAENDQSVSI
jgi:hypothetical protein